ncbi:MAG: hypothetical protein EAZ55_12820 [Cytophagales bacterium]|nr:MAG: hypothetical protein EAZ55_12820 [Cytophagales bacterium]
MHPFGVILPDAINLGNGRRPCRWFIGFWGYAPYFSETVAWSETSEMVEDLADGWGLGLCALF